MADEKKNPLGPVGEQVRANVERIRTVRGLTKKELADRTSDLGRAVPPLGVSRIEAGTRRVDADDLVALALALEVSPLTLLLPAYASGEPINLTSAYTVTSGTAWRWGLGQGPAMDWEPSEGDTEPESPPGSDESLRHEQEYGRRRTEYLRLALPPEMSRGSDHPLVRLARQLEGLLMDLAVTPGERSDRVRWARMAQRRVEQIKLGLEEVLEEGAVEEAPVRHPGIPLGDGSYRDTMLGIGRKLAEQGDNGNGAQSEA